MIFAYALTQAKAFADQISAQKAAQETVRLAKLLPYLFSAFILIALSHVEQSINSHLHQSVPKYHTHVISESVAKPAGRRVLLSYFAGQRGYTSSTF